MLNLNQLYNLLDIIAVVDGTSNLTYRWTVNHGLQPMIRVYLMDKSKFVIVLTLWGKSAQNFYYNENTVIWLKAARVSEMNDGYQLRHTADCIMKVNPDMDCAHDLRYWYNYEWNGKTRGCLSNC